MRNCPDFSEQRILEIRFQLVILCWSSEHTCIIKDDHVTRMHLLKKKQISDHMQMEKNKEYFQSVN